MRKRAVVATVATVHLTKQENHLKVSYLSLAVRVGGLFGWTVTLSTNFSAAK